MSTRFAFGLVYYLGQAAVEDFDDETALARTGDTGDADELAERNLDVDGFQVVFRGAADDQVVSVTVSSFGRYGYLAFVRQELPGQGSGTSFDGSNISGTYYPASVFSGPWPQVDDPVGSADGVRVVFYHHDSVAHISQALQSSDEARIVSLVQADGRFIQDVKYPHQLRADLCRQPDALRLSSGECRRHTVYGQVVQANVDQKA